MKTINLILTLLLTCTAAFAQSGEALPSTQRLSERTIRAIEDYTKAATEIAVVRAALAEQIPKANATDVNKQRNGSSVLEWIDQPMIGAGTLGMLCAALGTVLRTAHLQMYYGKDKDFKNPDKAIEAKNEELDRLLARQSAVLAEQKETLIRELWEKLIARWRK